MAGRGLDLLAPGALPLLLLASLAACPRSGPAVPETTPTTSAAVAGTMGTSLANAGHGGHAGGGRGDEAGTDNEAAGGEAAGGEAAGGEGGAASADATANLYAAAIAGSIPCGKGRCAAGRQACCEDASSISKTPPQCVALPGPDVSGTLTFVPRFVGASYQTCVDALDTSEVGFRLCDHSLQCPGQSICAHDDVSGFPIGPFVYCLDEAAGASMVERCRGRDQQCKTPESICLDGVCRRKQRRVRCGGRVCSEREFCWAGMGEDLATKGSCRRDPKRTGDSANECDDPNDCVAGQVCCSGQFNRCMFQCGGGDTPVALCADGSRCPHYDKAKCEACGARAK